MDKIEIHKRYCEKLNELYREKNGLYGDSFSKTWEEEGTAVMRIRLTDKLNRVKQITMRNIDTSDADETLLDTLFDLANYALMSAIEIANGAGK